MEPGDRLRLLLTVACHVSDAVLIAELTSEKADPRIVYANVAFERLTGYAASELIGASPRLLQGPLTSRGARRRVREALTTFERVDIQLINYRKNGETYLAEVSLIPVPGEGGRPGYFIAIERDITRRLEVEVIGEYAGSIEAENAKLAYTAFHDQLTGLHNRAYFLERLNGALERTPGRARLPCAVLFFDLDRFKFVNDTLGHATGDALLVHVAARVRARLRERDAIARFGGDEFAILIEDVSDPRRVTELAQRLLVAVREPFASPSGTISTNASIGIALAPGTRATPEALLEAADVAMYRAKALGGDRFVIAEDASPTGAGAYGSGASSDDDVSSPNAPSR